MANHNYVFVSGAVEFLTADAKDRRFFVVDTAEPDENKKGRYLGTKLRTTDLGQEKLCTKCMEWWPADGEFFFPSKGGIGGLFYCCKACYREAMVERKRLKQMVTEQPA